MDISYEYMIYHMNIIIWTIIQGVTKYFPVCIQCHRLGSRLSLPRIYTWAGCCCLRLLHPGRRCVDMEEDMVDQVVVDMVMEEVVLVVDIMVKIQSVICKL